RGLSEWWFTLKQSIACLFHVGGCLGTFSVAAKLVDRISRLVPASDRGDDLVGVGGPGEGFWIIVGFPQEAVYGGLEFNDGAKHATFETAPGQLCEEAFDRIEP